MSAGIRITEVNGIPLVVNVTRADGVAVATFSDSACTTPVTMPAAIVADTTLYVVNQGTLSVSLKVGGVELGPFTVVATNHQVSSVPVPDDADGLRRVAQAGEAGSEMGYAERTTLFQTTNTTLFSTSSKIGGLAVTVVGEGRPVDVEFGAAEMYGSVAGQHVVPYLIINGATTGGQFAAVDSPSTSVGRTGGFKRRLVLTAGVSYTFEVGAAVQSGTGNIGASADAPMSLSVTRR